MARWKQFGTFLLAGLLALPAIGAPRVDTRASLPSRRTINYVEGQAALNGSPLNTNSVGTAMQAGQVLTTQNGKVEVLLTLRDIFSG